MNMSVIDSKRQHLWTALRAAKSKGIKGLYLTEKSVGVSYKVSNHALMNYYQLFFNRFVPEGEVLENNGGGGKIRENENVLWKRSPGLVQKLVLC